MFAESLIGMATGFDPRDKPRPDWRATFDKFMDEHGRFPMTHDGLLLFPDGWRHEADYRGREIPPPADSGEAVALVRIYWTLRRKLAADELVRMEEHLRKMTELQGTRSVPIQFSRWVRDPETGERIKETQPLDLDELREQIADINDDIAMCEEHLA
jgi:hypothetical protein